MFQRGGFATGFLTASVVAALLYGAWWAFLRGAPEPKKSSSPPIPANVVADENGFNTITLPPATIENLKLGYGKVENGELTRTRLYSGEIVVPPGQTIVVAAPFSGVLQTAGGAPLQAGSSVQKGKTIFQLLPLLMPEGRANLAAAKVDADGQVRNAETQLAAAEKNLARARMLLADDVGSKQRVDDAEAAYHIAMRTLEATKKRSELLAKVAGEIDGMTAAAIPIESPATGLLRNVTAAHGQPVPAGALLFEVSDINDVWVRVPVYVGDLHEIVPDAPALIGGLVSRSREKTISADRISAPPSANSQTGAVDLYFKLDNRAVRYSPGQRVGASIALVGNPKALTVPAAAILYDIHGGTWVYARTGERTFARKRVVVEQVRGDLAHLKSGPPVGTVVVTDGAIELFGTETGYSK